MLDRAKFIASIAAAIARGRAKIGEGFVITTEEATERARQVADKLPTLFESEGAPR